MPAPDTVRPMQMQQQQQQLQQPTSKNDADIMGGLMEGGGIGAMGMPAGGMVMTGQNAAGKFAGLGVRPNMFVLRSGRLVRAG